MPSGPQDLTLDVEGKMDNVAEVVMAGDARVTEQTLQVVFYALDDDVRVDGEDRDERLHVVE